MAAAASWRSPLVPGIRDRQDAERLALELTLAEGLLLTLTVAPGDYWQKAAADSERDEACRAVFIGAWLVGDELSDDPFAAARAARAGQRAVIPAGALGADPGAAGAEISFERFAARGGGPYSALLADPAWRAARRFERVAERLSLPGLTRALRFRTLVLLGRLGLIEARAPALLLAGAGPYDRTLAAGVRIFAHDEPQELERRAAQLAEAVGVPFDVLDLALWNLSDAPRATFGEAPGPAEGPALERIGDALRLRH